MSTEVATLLLLVACDGEPKESGEDTAADVCDDDPGLGDFLLAQITASCEYSTACAETTDTEDVCAAKQGQLALSQFRPTNICFLGECLVEIESAYDIGACAYTAPSTDWCVQADLSGGAPEAPLGGDCTAEGDFAVFADEYWSIYCAYDAGCLNAWGATEEECRAYGATLSDTSHVHPNPCYFDQCLADSLARYPAGSCEGGPAVPDESCIYAFQGGE